MRNFSLGNLSQWQPVGIGEVVFLDGRPGYPQLVRFEALTTGEVVIRARGSDDVERVVAVGDGLLRVRFVGVGSLELWCESAEACAPQVFVRRRTEPQLVAGTDVPSFTTIEPRAAGPSDELRRMMYQVQLNQQRREAELLQHVERLGADYEKTRKELLAERKAASAARKAAEKAAEKSPAEVQENVSPEK